MEILNAKGESSSSSESRCQRRPRAGEHTADSPLTTCPRYSHVMSGKHMKLFVDPYVTCMLGCASKNKELSLHEILELEGKKVHMRHRGLLNFKSHVNINIFSYV